MIKRFITGFLLLSMVTGSLTSAVYAKDDLDGEDDSSVEDEMQDESDDDSEDESDDDSEDDSDDDSDDDKYEDEVFYEDDEDSDDSETEEDGEVIVEEVDTDDYDEEALDTFASASTEEDATTSFLLSVRWGYFLDEGAERPDLDVTNWDGTVSFENGVFALPVKLLRFEKSHDGIDFSSTTAQETVFESHIYNATDGLLFKVKADLSGAETGIENIPSVTFNADAFMDGGIRVSLPYLLEEGEYVVQDGDYEVVFNVYTAEDVVKGKSENTEIDHSIAGDAEVGSWYEMYMNLSVLNGFFGGDRNKDGSPKGTIRPGDSITRLELIKVAYELASKLDLSTGVDANGCDPKTVALGTETDWMGDHWARGYVQCVQNSGVTLTLLDEVIAGDLDSAGESAKRWEVMLTVIEMLGVDAKLDSEAEFPDLDEVSDDAEAAIDISADLGVIAGYPDGYFKPEKSVNRAEMFKIVSLFYEVYGL